MVRQLTAAKCHSIVALRDSGLQQSAIARQLRITQGTVSKVLKRNAETGVPTARPRPGRPFKTTRCQDRLLTRMCTGGRSRTASSLRREWQKAINVRVSVSLVNKRLVKAGLRARRPLRMPLLTPVRRQNRLQWAQNHRHLQAGHWSHVVFSDEARFEVYRHDGRMRVRRRDGEQYRDDCILPRVQAGGGGITVWGAFHAGGKSRLVVLDGNLNQRSYRVILEHTMLPFARGAFQDNFVFQQDNAPAHRAHSVADYLQTEGVEVLPWPPYSPDMNPIENLWAEVTRRINNLNFQPTDVAQLRQAVMTAWADIPLLTLRTLSAGMPRRLEALRAARGGHTRY